MTLPSPAPAPASASATAPAPAPAATTHVPVLLAEAMGGLAVRPGGRYLDGTVGGGGHAEAILRASAPDGRLLGLDRDPGALARASARLAPFGARAALVHGSFGDLGRHAAAEGFEAFEGVVLDLGISSDQLADPARGLSFQADGPLDMRLDPTHGPTAAELLGGLDEGALADLIFSLGEERASRRIARAIVAARPVETTAALAAIVERALGRPHGRAGRIHPATRTFQALRMAVNDELGQLAAALPQAVEWLAPGGRLVVITFHSLEDRLVKRALRAMAGEPAPDAPPHAPRPPARLRLVGRRGVAPSPTEVDANPRARSARMRVAERLDDGEVAA